MGNVVVGRGVVLGAMNELPGMTLKGIDIGMPIDVCMGIRIGILMAEPPRIGMGRPAARPVPSMPRAKLKDAISAPVVVMKRIMLFLLNVPASALIASGSQKFAL
jgi:hypothetical protein